MILDARGNEIAILETLPVEEGFKTKALSIINGFSRELEAMRVNNLNTGLQGVLNGFGREGGLYGGHGINMPGASGLTSTFGLISLDRITLSYDYVHQGLVKTFIDQPIDDAFRGGVKFKSGQLDDEELSELNRCFIQQREVELKKKSSDIVRSVISSGADLTGSDMAACMETGKWSSLFGGAGTIINTDQPFGTALRPESIREDSPLEFIAADRWELTLMNLNVADPSSPRPYSYYGLPLHFSRVIKRNWDPAPSFIRRQLQGWGMSALESTIRAINMFLKFENLLFELLDEAKIDVFGIQGFNTALATDRGTALVQRRVALNNQLKNYSSALTMDKEDTYEQKQLQFAGLADIWDRLALNLCAYLRRPFNKLFGQSAGGFSSGDDSMDNYNMTVETIRQRLDPTVLTVGSLRCQQLFGMIPDDLETEYTPLTVMDGKEEEEVKTMQQARLDAQLANGTLNPQEYAESMKKLGLLYVDSDVLNGAEAVPPMTMNPEEMQMQQEHDLAMVKAKPKPAAGAKKK